jgi:GT2 family glycosyltransferase
MQPMANDTTNAWWDRLLEYRDSLSDAGMIACNLMYPQKDHWAAGEVQCAGGTFTNGVIGHHRGHVSQDVLDRIRIVDWVTFGGVLIRRELLDACGSFDSKYRWAYVMDVDYCFEARLRGFRLYQVPVRLTHHENRTTRSILDNDPAAKAAVAFNLQTFYDKWGPLAPYLPSRISVGRETFGFGSRMLRSSRKLLRRVR